MPVIGDCEVTPEPKEQRREVKAMLRAAFTDMNVKMVSDREYTSTGLQYTERFTSYMEVLSALSLLPWWQRVALVRNVGPERATQETIAAALGVARQTVCGYITDGLTTMADRIYQKLT
jgi:hypothetical protein